MLITKSQHPVRLSFLLALCAAAVGTGCVTTARQENGTLRPITAAAVAGADGSTSERAAPTATRHEGEVAAHGGVLNAIVTCENGHAEIKKDGDRLSLWFVDGGTSSDRAVRVPAPDVDLKVAALNGGSVHHLRLMPHPLTLAGEKRGACSYFEGGAPWLTDLSAFVATGQISFKGNLCPLRIEYPMGYDPD